MTFYRIVMQLRLLPDRTRSEWPDGTGPEAPPTQRRCRGVQTASKPRLPEPQTPADPRLLSTDPRPSPATRTLYQTCAPIRPILSRVMPVRSVKSSRQHRWGEKRLDRQGRVLPWERGRPGYLRVTDFSSLTPGLAIRARNASSVVPRSCAPRAVICSIMSVRRLISEVDVSS